MKLPISERLLACASLVPNGCRVADVGTDHGYLAIHLLQSGIASFVYAADLRQKPLESARSNAEKFSVQNIEFRLSDGLSAFSPDELDCVVCAGMGGDLISMILQAAPWLKDRRYTLILQPQSAAPALRAWLAENGFAIRDERLLFEGGFYYTVLRAQYDAPYALTPGGQHLSPQLLSSNSPLLPAYLARLESLLQTTVDGLSSAEKQRPEKLAYFRQALGEIQEMRKLL